MCLTVRLAFKSLCATFRYELFQLLISDATEAISAHVSEVSFLSFQNQVVTMFLVKTSKQTVSN